MNVMVSRVIDKSDNWNTIFKLYSNESGDLMDMLRMYLCDSEIYEGKSISDVFNSYQDPFYIKYINEGLELSHFFGLYQDPKVSINTNMDLSNFLQYYNKRNPDNIDIDTGNEIERIFKVYQNELGITNADMDLTSIVEIINNTPQIIDINTSLGLATVFGSKILDKYLLLTKYKDTYKNQKLNHTHFAKKQPKTEIDISEKIGYFEDVIFDIIKKELKKKEYEQFWIPVRTALTTLIEDINFVYLNTASPANKNTNASKNKKKYKEFYFFNKDYKRRKSLFEYFGYNLKLSDHNINNRRDGINREKIYILTPPEKDDKQITDDDDELVPFSKVGGCDLTSTITS